MKLIKTKNFELAANIAGDESAPMAAILMPGRLDTKDYANFVSHLDLLASHGLYAIAIDPPGTWDSPGSLDNYTTSTYLKAVNELIDYLGNRPTLLVGHSRGGATAMLASANPAVAGIVVVNSAFGSPTPPKPRETRGGILPEYRDLPPGNVRTNEKKRFDLPMAYFEDGPQHDPEGSLNKFKGPKLVIHADKDEFVTTERVKGVFDNLSEPKMFLQISSTHDYRLYPQAIQAVNDALGQFVDKYLST